MKYYNKEGKEIIFDTENSYCIGGGKFGRVFEFGKDACFKIYNKDCPVDTRILEDIKNYHLFHYDALKELFYTDSGTLAGYIMKRYQKDLPDFYIMSTKEFLREFNTLERDADVLSENQIFINDMTYKNTMSFHNRLKLVDYDLYKRTNNPNIKHTNHKLLLWLWHDILFKQRELNGYKTLFTEQDILEFFNPSSGNLDIVREKLEDKKLVIDGFIKR